MRSLFDKLKKLDIINAPMRFGIGAKFLLINFQKTIDKSTICDIILVLSKDSRFQ